MSNFDLSQVLAQANKVEAESKESGGSKTKLVYPQNGTLKVKLLFDPKSQLVIRKFERHTVGETKVACLSQYGIDCPVCKILSDINNAKGVDLWKFKRTTRGICYAEYISDNYKWDKPDNKPQPGEIIMLMFPWSVYQDLNRIMSQAGPNLAQVVATNVGTVINIERYVQGGQTKYSSNIDAFNMSHKTRGTDQEFNELLMSLDDLNEKFVPVSITDEVQAKAREVAEQLSREYLNVVEQPKVDTKAGTLASAVPTNPAVPPTPNYYRDPSTGMEYDLINNQWVPRMQVPPVPPVPPTLQTPPAPPAYGGVQQPNASNNPACFGKHGKVDANQCLVCFKEAECASSSK